MRVPVPADVLPAERLGRVHFVGVGGAGLSAIARVMAARGIPVSGSDARDSATLDALRGEGVTVRVGHAADHVEGADTVVVSTAVREDNPEVVEATRRGLRLWPRSAAMQSVLLGRRALAVAGTHGKTTTTSLLAMALRECGVDPSFTVGGDLTQLGTNAHAGTGDLFVAEADESDGAFLVYTPFAAVVTNVEADHLDVWGTEEAYRQAFVDFLGRVDRDGFVVVCVDDPGGADLARTAGSMGLKVVTVGESESADLRAVDLELVGRRSSYSVVSGDTVLGRVHLQIPGRHYVVDSLLALATGLRLGLPYADLVRGLEAFAGTGRRMELKGEVGGVRVYDSYAHHPREIAGDLEAARALAGTGRVVVAFQPHLVSRTRLFGAEMGRALGAADEVVVMEVYLAREDPDPAVTATLVADAVPLPAGRVHRLPDGEVAAALVTLAGPGDLILTLGAGDVTEIGPRVVSLLEEAG